MSVETKDKPNQETRSRNDQDVLGRLQTFYEGMREKEARATEQKLVELRDSFAREFATIFPVHQRESIMTRLTPSAATRESGRRDFRHKSLLDARRNGVDLEAIAKLQHHVRFEDIVRADRNNVGNEVIRGSVADRLEQLPNFFNVPDPDSETVFRPTYDGSWDRSSSSFASGDGNVDVNNSYLDDGFARLGSKLVAQNHDASDVDAICAYREGGFLVPFKTLKTGILQVNCDLSCLVCRHHVSTDDEWGWSDFHATTRGRLILAVFWKWEDVDPANQVSDQWFTAGVDVSGDGESYPGTTIQATPGEQRIINLYTDIAFPAHADLWIYVGLSDRIWAFLNDVGIDMSIDSAWQLNSIGVRSL